MTAAASPSVTVLLPVFNAQAYLEGAVRSVLAQTWRDFELLAVDDGSTDESPALLARWAPSEPRLRVVTLAHQGLVPALNYGLKLARGRYVARLDADDVCRPERLARQVAFLERRPEVVACGSAVHVLGGPAAAVWSYPVAPAAARCHLLFGPPFCHPAVMLRRAALERHKLAYDPAYREAEDYALWAQLAEIGALANLPNVLLDYRVHAGQKRQRDREAVSNYGDRVRQAQLAQLGLEPTGPEWALHRALGEETSGADAGFLEQAAAWLGRLRQANGDHAAFPEPAFTQVLAERWFRACWRAAPMGWAAWRAFWGSPLGAAANLSVTRRLKFALRCARRLGSG